LDDEVSTRVVEREGNRTDLSNNPIEELRHGDLDLGSFLHILELADSFFSFHNPDHRDESRTYTVGFLELDLDTRSSEGEVISAIKNSPFRMSFIRYFEVKIT
jgi:hypothetical protein